MICPHQGICGGCALSLPYEEQWKRKEAHFRELLAQSFKELASLPFALHPSPSHSFRARAEFRIYRAGDSLSYAMNRLNSKGSKALLPIASCPILLESIQALMPPLLKMLQASRRLSHRLFGIEFLSGLSQEVVASLLYHGKLDSAWEAEAHKLRQSLTQATIPNAPQTSSQNAAIPALSALSLIGRSKGQKLILGESSITERLHIRAQEWRYLHFESSFTQPNPYVNEQMIEWILSLPALGDLLELYCGAGNFTLPLSTRYPKILATEVSKTSIAAAKRNCELNGIKNITFARLNAKETQSALNRERSFERLKGIALDSYSFGSVFVDPPRAGIGKEVAEFLAHFHQILYISCNQNSLLGDLKSLTRTHRVKQIALFDQFPYTPHLELGVFLQKD